VQSKPSIYLEWLISDVSFDVLHQKCTIFELFQTQRALIEQRLLVSLHVLLEQIAITKLFAAVVDRTEHRRGFGVSLLMERETRRIEKSFITLKTLIGFVREMRLDVHHE